MRFSDNLLVFGDQSARRFHAARARDAVHVDVFWAWRAKVVRVFARRQKSGTWPHARCNDL